MWGHWNLVGPGCPRARSGNNTVLCARARVCVCVRLRTEPWYILGLINAQHSTGEMGLLAAGCTSCDLRYTLDPTKDTNWYTGPPQKKVTECALDFEKNNEARKPKVREISKRCKFLTCVCCTEPCPRCRHDVQDTLAPGDKGKKNRSRRYRRRPRYFARGALLTIVVAMFALSACVLLRRYCCKWRLTIADSVVCATCVSTYTCARMRARARVCVRVCVYLCVCMCLWLRVMYVMCLRVPACTFFRNLNAEYERRSGNVDWLETHIWHAKRMHMANMWGWRLPVSPCEKSARAAHRVRIAPLMCVRAPFTTAVHTMQGRSMHDVRTDKRGCQTGNRPRTKPARCTTRRTARASNCTPLTQYAHACIAFFERKR